MLSISPKGALDYLVANKLLTAPPNRYAGTDSCRRSAALLARGDHPGAAGWIDLACD